MGLLCSTGSTQVDYVRTSQVTDYSVPTARVPELQLDGSIVKRLIKAPAAAKGYGAAGKKRAEKFLDVALPMAASHVVGMKMRQELGRAVLLRGAPLALARAPRLRVRASFAHARLICAA